MKQKPVVCLLQTDIYKNSQFTTFAVGDKNEVKINGIVHNFSELSALLGSLRDSQAFENVDLVTSSRSASQDNVRFSISAKLYSKNSTSTTTTTTAPGVNQ